MIKADDFKALITKIGDGRHIVVIGGGLLGTELSTSLALQSILTFLW
jgi:NAD(P)H-nitrite reductase large subunit